MASIHADNCRNPYEETKWKLKDFQRANSAIGKLSEVQTFLAHIRAGVEALHCRPEAVLCLSGGHTDASVPRSEAESYQSAMEQTVALDENLNSKRIILEESSTDSYQNLLFSILEYRKALGYYPLMITVVTHAFKTERFTELHRRAIRWPAERFRVIGINPSFTSQEYKATLDNESRNALVPFAQDPYGLRSPLSEKRQQRGWTFNTVNLIVKDLQAHTVGVEPEVVKLLQWTGGADGREHFPEVAVLPWE